jgi:hypothetical protein
MTVARELVRYKLDLVGLQKVRWDKVGKVGTILCFMGKEEFII